nr:protein kinase-like domain, phloem protein 2-like protein [Tanacetum cinerariifolium]
MMSDFSVKIAWKDIRPRAIKVLWFRIVWFSHYVPRHAFHLWLVMRKNFKMKDKLRQWDVDLALCPSASWYGPGPPRLQDIVAWLHPRAHKRHNELLVFVPKWMKCYEQKILEEIIFKGLDMKQIDPSSIKLFSDIAYKCLNETREERPTMAEVVSQLEVAFQAQEHYEVFLEHPLAKEYEEILRTAVPPVIYRSIEELKQRLSQWVLINEGHTVNVYFA